MHSQCCPQRFQTVVESCAVTNATAAGNQHSSHLWKLLLCCRAGELHDSLYQCICREEKELCIAFIDHSEGLLRQQFFHQEVILGWQCIIANLCIRVQFDHPATEYTLAPRSTARLPITHDRSCFSRDLHICVMTVQPLLPCSQPPNAELGRRVLHHILPCTWATGQTAIDSMHNQSQNASSTS